MSHDEQMEEAALVADAEGDRLDALVAEMRQQIAIAPRRGLKWRLDEYLAGARATRRIASTIRQQELNSDPERDYWLSDPPHPNDEKEEIAMNDKGWKSPPPTIEEMLDRLDQSDSRVQDIRRMYEKINWFVQQGEPELQPMIIAHLEWCNAVLESKTEAGELGPMYIMLAEALEDLRQFIEPPRPAEVKP